MDREGVGRGTFNSSFASGLALGSFSRVRETKFWKCCDHFEGSLRSGIPFVVIKNRAWVVMKGLVSEVNSKETDRRDSKIIKRGASKYPERRELHVRRLALGHLHDHDAQRPDIDLGVVLLTAAKLGRHPVRRAHNRLTLVLLLGELGRITEIGCTCEGRRAVSK
jgi:hypothetical protein